MDFSKETVKDLPTHGYDKSVPTFWLLEGLVMYLTPEVISDIIKQITELSGPGHCIMVNYINS